MGIQVDDFHFQCLNCSKRITFYHLDDKNGWAKYRYQWATFKRYQFCLQLSTYLLLLAYFRLCAIYDHAWLKWHNSSTQDSCIWHCLVDFIDFCSSFIPNTFLSKWKIFNSPYQFDDFNSKWYHHNSSANDLHHFGNCNGHVIVRNNYYF